MFSRRQFLLSSLGVAVGGCRMLDFSGLSVAGVRIGVQMWSVHELWKKDPVKAFRRLKGLGYDGVQSFGFYSMDWNELEKMLDGEGLAVIDMPFYMKTLEGDGEKRFLEFCNRFGITFAFEPSTSSFKTPDEWRRHGEWLRDVRRRFAARGIRVGFHNHQREFTERYGGKSPFQYLYEAGIDFELDVGHAKIAGEDPVAWLKCLDGRVPSIHVKPAGGLAVGDAKDRNDWPAIFAAAAAAGTTWGIVECEQRRNTYDDVIATARTLAAM